MPPQTSPRRSRIAHFKAPFIVSLAASAALGCGGKANVTDPDVLEVPLEENRPLAETSEGCPSSLPSTGSACQVEETELCSYYPNCPSTARCVDGSWDTTLLACNPPPPLQNCPDAEPEAGTTCWGYLAGLTCEYPFCYDTAPTVRCGADWEWEALPLPSCNPPPVVESCPEAMPEPGSDCANEELFCGYEGCQGPESSTAVCRHSQWLVEYSSDLTCNPPPVVPSCPGVEPTSGAGCAYEGQACGYGICGDLIDARRVHSCASGTWQTLEAPCAPGAGADDAGAGGVDAGAGNNG
jgi:hypothetical protein